MQPVPLEQQALTRPESQHEELPEQQVQMRLEPALPVQLAQQVQAPLRKQARQQQLGLELQVQPEQPEQPVQPSAQRLLALHLGTPREAF